MHSGTVSLKTGMSQADREREVVCVRTLGHTRPVYRAMMDTTPMRTVALTKSVHARARVTRDLAAAVSFCASRSFDLVLHAHIIHITPRGVVIDIGNAPDTRFEPPEGGYSPSWSIGCVLHKMITGRAPVTLLDVENHTETLALVRCLGAPTLSDSLALGIPVPDRKARYDRISRRKVPGASFAENIILSETLAWDPVRRMRCTSAGLVSATSIDIIEEVEEGDD
ncbi:MAG: hypothetical protein EBZ77_08305 [Chitinophagia bacterium]|nr:hypothetical protein [Chitinophagia bacterium]